MLIAVLAFGYHRKIPVLSLGDVTCAVGPIGLLLGRLANFVNGELWGRPADPTLPWAMVFPTGGPVPRHPSQLYEAGLEGLTLFLVLLWGTHAAKLLPRKGALSGMFLVGYGISRILLEGVREPDRDMPHFPLGLTMGMMLSIPMVLAGIALILMSRKPTSLAPPDPAASGSMLDDARKAA